MREPRRILHVIERMNRAGIETWLMSILRRIDRRSLCMDFLVHTTEPSDFDEEIRGLGSQLLVCHHPHKPIRYAHNFKLILDEHKPYDVIHCHADHFSGYPLLLAKRHGIPCRIAHSHLDTRPLQNSATPMRRIYYGVVNRWIRKHATHCIAVSQNAAAAMFGESWRSDARCRILHCGIDVEPFTEIVDPASVRTELGVSPMSKVVGHVGRFCQQKNHCFITDIASELVKRDSAVRILMVGDGPLRKEIQQDVTKRGLTPYFVFTGARADVARLMLGAMDAFVFPSLNEGLGLALVEAQTAGLPCVVAKHLPEEADIVTDSISRIPLSDGASKWAAKILAVLDTSVKKPRIDKIRNSPFEAGESLRALQRIYA